MDLPEIGFDRIRPLSPGGKRDGFETFVCELAADDPPDASASFVSLHGAGGDGGVECFWTLSDGTEQGWQAKYWTTFAEVDKAQLDSSVNTALDVHPNLTSYTIAIPIDPTGPTKRAGESQLQRFEQWRQGWLALAQSKGMAVEFKFAWKSDLAGRLLDSDPSGVRTRYWFDADLLTESWWKHRLDDALQAARPRYVPELAVPVPAGTVVAALCNDPEWRAVIDSHLEQLDRALDMLGYASGAVADLDSVREAVQAVVAAVDGWHTQRDAKTRSELDSTLVSARELIDEQSERESIALTERHGNWDTPGWRQFQAEYQGIFPASAVDAFRELADTLAGIVSSLSGPFQHALRSNVALMVGAAGTGKTFVACDVVSGRLSHERPSVMVHGRWFGEGDILISLRDRLHLPTDLTGIEALELLDQAGRTASSPTLLVIDALNETVPRRVWFDQIDRLITAANRFEHLRLVLTVRTHHKDEVIPAATEVLEFEHRGFEGIEFDFVGEYAEYFELEPPAAPPVQLEMRNPLYLRLLCESLQASDSRSMTQAWAGIDDLLNMLLDAKNDAVSQRLGAPVKDRLVQRAMHGLAKSMATDAQPWITRNVARSITTTIWPDQSAEGSLLEALIAEGLVSEDTVPEGAARIDIVAMAFERMGQHLAVTEMVRGMTLEELREQLNDTDGLLYRLVAQDESIDPGLLEAVSVVLADRYSIELTALHLDSVDLGEQRRAVLAGIPWRSPDSVTIDTAGIVHAAMLDGENFALAIELAFRMAATPGIAVNADWLDGFLRQFDIISRDHFLVPWLHSTCDTNGAVDALIDWALNRDLAGLDIEPCRLWVTALLWCTGASDRRVRDRASVGATRLLKQHPSLIPELLARFLDGDDDWINERVLVCSYSALCLAGSEDDWSRAARVVWSELFQDPPPANVSIRDEGRSILEGALDRGVLPDGAMPEAFRPPFESAWPIQWPDEASLDPVDSADYPRIVDSSTNDDFFIYQISPLLRPYEAEVDLAAAGRRIALDVVRSGYDPDRHGAFDRYLLGQYGPGRSKPSSIERLGKKYQWIALARLAGVVADHVERRRSSWEVEPSGTPPPQALEMRQLDPSVCEPLRPSRYTSEELRPSYDWQSADPSDSTWVRVNDVPEIGVINATVEGRPHVILDGIYDWDELDPVGPNRRRLWRHVRTLFVPTDDLEQTVSAMEGLNLFNEHLIGIPTVRGVLVAEYPTGLAALEQLDQIAKERHDLLPEGTVPGAVEIAQEYGYAPSELRLDGVVAPGPTVFGAVPGELRWDGDSAWRDGDGRVMAKLRQAPGVRELTVDRAWLDRRLEAQELSVVWVEGAGKDVLTDNWRSSPGRLLTSLVRYRGTAGLEQTSAVTST